MHVSIMEDTQEFDKWVEYSSRGGMETDHHEIRSHRVPREPRAFPIHRLLLVFMAVALSAGFINADLATSESASADPLSAPESVRWIDPRADRGSRLDESAEGDTAVRTANPERTGRQSAVKKLPPVPPIEKAIAYALAQQGKPYRWAQAGPYGFDCSGLVLAAYRQIGIKLPHFTGTMIAFGKRISRQDMQRGDVVFPSSGHVGIYLGNGMMVHASSSKGRIVVAKVYSFYAARRLV
jgi:cell wall-associated NlpC family hydrolase